MYKLYVVPFQINKYYSKFGISKIFNALKEVSSTKAAFILSKSSKNNNIVKYFNLK